MKRNKKKKNVYSIISIICMVLTVIGVVAWAGVYAVNYAVGEDEVITNADGTKSTTIGQKKKMINALICGTNEDLTDTMMYVKYNVENGKIAMMSIPRDTYVINDYAYGHKLNSIYRGKNIVPLVEEIQELLDVKIDYYVIFDTKMVNELVDAMGGIEVDVPIRMKYDDYTQDLHIDLKPGVQVLNGKQAEHFVRFRHNNDFTVQYPMGDLGRIKVQQDFMKTLISALVQPKNITKAPELINIGLSNTVTNVTLREATKYISDASKIDIQNIQSATAPGTTPYIDNISYFKMDEKEAKRIIKEDFNLETTSTPPSTEKTESENN